MLSVKVVVGGGGTSCAVNVMEWPFPSSSLRVLSTAMHCWVLVVTEIERLSDGIVLVVLLGNIYNDGGGAATAALGWPERSE